MLTSLILPLFGLLSKFYTFYTFLQYIHNPFLLLLCTVLTIFLQVVFVDQILPYASQFNTKFHLFLKTYILYGKPIILTNFVTYNASSPICLIYRKRKNRSLIQDVTPFLNNIIFQYTNSLPFETEPHTIYTFHWQENIVTLTHITFDIKHLK